MADSPEKPVTVNELGDFVAWVLSKENLPYCWPTAENGYSGKDLKSAKYKDCYDCSGLITAGLYAATGKRIDWRANTNAQFLLKKSQPLTDKQAKGKACLAFYGPAMNMINHVMLVLPDGRSFGACGGNSAVTSPEIAAKKGARVRYRATHAYRPDFRCFRAIPLEGEWPKK